MGFGPDRGSASDEARADAQQQAGGGQCLQMMSLQISARADIDIYNVCFEAQGRFNCCCCAA
jgi:hypothetical protein